MAQKSTIITTLILGVGAGIFWFISNNQSMKVTTEPEIPAANLLLENQESTSNKKNDIPLPTQSENVTTKQLNRPQFTEQSADTPSIPEWDLRDALPVTGSLISAVIKQGDYQIVNETTSSDDDYRFPEVVDAGNNEWAMIISDDPIPSRSARRQLHVGDGVLAKAGDTIHFRYDMFSWATGELVETTQNLETQSLSLTLGNLVNSAQVPKALHNALFNRTAGSRIQVIFKQSMEDLPDYLDPNDGYVLIVEIDQVQPMNQQEADDTAVTL